MTFHWVFGFVDHEVSVFYAMSIKLHLSFFFCVSTALKYPQIQISLGIHSSRQSECLVLAIN